MIVFKGGGLSSGGSRSGTGKGFGGLVAYLQNGHRANADPERAAWTSTRNLDDITDPRTPAGSCEPTRRRTRASSGRSITSA